MTRKQAVLIGLGTVVAIAIVVGLMLADSRVEPVESEPQSTEPLPEIAPGCVCEGIDLICEDGSTVTSHPDCVAQCECTQIMYVPGLVCPDGSEYLDWPECREWE